MFKNVFFPFEVYNIIKYYVKHILLICRYTYTVYTKTKRFELRYDSLDMEGQIK